jgi:hypothetical protein
VSGLQPLSFEETNKYIQHRLRVAGHRGEPLFSAAALARITEFAAGVPRNINSLCFNAMSLGCALQQKVMDAAIVEEVISDLDITRHTSKAFRGPTELGPGAAQVYEGSTAQVYEGSPSANFFAPVSSRPNGGSHASHLSPAEARAYMEQITAQLHRSNKLVSEALSERTKPPSQGNLE